jgi:hypothetical protein
MSKLKSLFSYKPLICPKCDERITRRQLTKWQCPYCHTAVTLADSYSRWIWSFTIAFVIALGIATHRTDSGGTWLFWLFLSALPINFILNVMLPPWLKEGTFQFRFTFVAAFFLGTIDVFVVVFVIFTIAVLLLGTKSDVREHLALLSWPLDLISPNFLITPEKSFTDVCGVILGDGLLYGSWLFGCFRLVHWAWRKGRPTQLSLSGRNPTDED